MSNNSDRARLAVAAATALFGAIENLGDPTTAAHAVVLVIDARGQMSCATTIATLPALAETLRRAAVDTGHAHNVIQDADPTEKN